MKFFIQVVDCTSATEYKPYIISNDITELSNFINEGRYYAEAHMNEDAIEDIDEYYFYDRNYPDWEYSDDPVEYENELVEDKLRDDMKKCLEDGEEFVYIRIIKEEEF